MVAVFWIFRRFTPARVDGWFRRGQLVSAALYSLGHGGNDAQKTMGIIAVLLYANGILGDDVLRAALGRARLPRARWASARCPAAGASSRTMGLRITKLKPVGGFCAETGGAITLFLATHLGVPVSTTHTITGAIVGVGSVTQARRRCAGASPAASSGRGC